MIRRGNGRESCFGWRRGARQGGQLREAEVEHLRVAARSDEDVGRLDVTVDDSAAVSGVERVGDLDRDVDRSIDIERLLLYDMSQRVALEQLHDDELPPGVLADVVHGADVRVVEGRGGARLALEPFGRGAIRGQRGRKELDGDRTSEANVFPSIDDTHPAAAQLGGNAIRADGLADHWRRDYTDRAMDRSS